MKIEKEILFHLPGYAYSELLYSDFKENKREEDEIVNILEDRLSVEKFDIKKAPTLVSVRKDGSYIKILEGDRQIP